MCHSIDARCTYFKTNRRVGAGSKILAAKGTKELLLIAQDSTFYGLDIYKERKLASLMEQLCTVDGIEWIRLHYAFPSGFPLDVLDVMQRENKICKYLDIPLQHASDSMLKSMRRGITSDKTRALLDTVRNKIPNIAIRTTFISGYPGETEQDHETLIRFLEELRFERVGVFTYSHEENTHAYTLNDDVDETTKQRRLDELMQVQQNISDSINQKKSEKVSKHFSTGKKGTILLEEQSMIHRKLIMKF